MAFDLITVSDRRHSSLQKGFNLRWPLGNLQGQSSPNGANLIYLCRSPQDIMDAAAQALALPNGRITVRSGGHCYEGFVANKMPDSPDEVLSILDISALSQVVYDASGQIGSALSLSLIGCAGAPLPKGFDADEVGTAAEEIVGYATMGDYDSIVATLREDL